MESVNIYKSPSPQFAKVMATLMGSVRYKPGQCKGVPCKMPYPLEMTFARTN